jgi:hypothetical protein
MIKTIHDLGTKVHVKPFLTILGTRMRATLSFSMTGRILD